MSPRLSAFATTGDRIHLTCMHPGCPYGGRAHMAADLLARYGDITMAELKTRAACGEWRRRRDEGSREPRHRVVLEVSNPKPPKMGMGSGGWDP